MSITDLYNRRISCFDVIIALSANSGRLDGEFMHRCARLRDDRFSRPSLSCCSMREFSNRSRYVKTSAKNIAGINAYIALSWEGRLRKFRADREDPSSAFLERFSSFVIEFSFTVRRPGGIFYEAMEFVCTEKSRALKIHEAVNNETGEFARYSRAISGRRFLDCFRKISETETPGLLAMIMKMWTNQESNLIILENIFMSHGYLPK